MRLTGCRTALRRVYFLMVLVACYLPVHAPSIAGEFLLDARTIAGDLAVNRFPAYLLEEALEVLAGLLRDGDVVLVKASRAVGLEEVARMLVEEVALA